MWRAATRPKFSLPKRRPGRARPFDTVSQGHPILRSTTGSITTALARLRDRRDDGALEQLLPMVYEELRVLARRQRRRLGGPETLNTTGLVHEVYLKLVGAERVHATDRAHFFAIAARAMRQVLSNYARSRQRSKRGGGQIHITLDSAADLLMPDTDHADTLVALDEALDGLASRSDRQRQVVECRVYGGMSIPETALALGISEATVKRDWTVAQAWLYRELKSG